MANQKQKNAAKENIKKAQKTWGSMSSRERSLAQPEGRSRAKPGSTGEGNFFRIVVRPKQEFTSFRIQDIGDKGHIERLAGRRSSGSWDTQAWFISKSDAHMESKRLVADTDDARKVIDTLQTEPKHIKGDTFEARDRRNVPEKDKPTEAQKKAWSRNIQKAQESNRHAL